MHFYLYSIYGILVWYYTEKKWQYGLEPTQEVSLCHTVSVPALVHTMVVYWQTWKPCETTRVDGRKYRIS